MSRGTRSGPGPGRATSPAARLAVLPVLAAGALLVAPPVPAEPADPVPDAVVALRAAREAHESGAREQALAALEPLAEGPLAAHAQLIRARWLREGDDPAAAVQAAVQGLAEKPASEIRSSLHYEIAQAELARGNLAAAYKAQEAAWTATRSSELSGQLSAELARVFEEQGLPGDALRLNRKIWQRWPTSSASGRAYDRGRYLERATGAPPPAAKPLVAYADRLRRSYRCERAIAIYGSVLARKKLAVDLRARGARGRADCLFQRRRYADAREAYAAILAADRKNFEAELRISRSYARAGQSAEALAGFAKLRKRANARGRARVDYLTAIVVRTEQPQRYRRLLARVEQQKASPALAQLAGWRLAWEDVLAERWASAIPRLKPLARGSIFDIEVQRARYWIAMARRASGDPQGVAGLRELAAEIPLSYYGLVAADQLAIEPVIEHSFVSGEPGDEDFLPPRRARWLIEGGFPQLARAELESWFRGRKLSRAQRMAAAPLLHQLGDHFRAIRLLSDGFGGTLERGVDPEWRAAWENSWPQPFGPEVEAAVSEFDFDRALVYAVMREESAYRPGVQSPAGARGLMQIIPPTGTRIASTLGVNPFDPKLLYQPDLNIRFGTYYLKYLMELFEGSRPLAIAAYNAGPEAVSTWVERDGPLPLDAFVDSIPYSETRRYLRKVYRSWRVYRLLYPRLTAPPGLIGAAPQSAGVARR